jgi:DNA-binding NtrC family response regulator
MMIKRNALKGKNILIVDDEPDILETLEDLLSMCEITKAASFEEAKELLNNQYFDIVILDIMGVAGYDLLEIASRRKMTAVMLTAYALTPKDVAKSHKGGAAFFVPKEEMINIETFLNDILEAKEKGESTWNRWFDRMASFCEKKFGPDWQKDEKDFWERFPFY